MPYRQVEFRAGHYYHLYNRGAISFEHKNYLFFLRRLRKYFLSERMGIIAYCLMANHYHPLVHLRVDDLASIMQPFTLSYTKAVNKRYGRIGALFQGRFKALLVNADDYLAHLSRYIHLNPIMAGLTPTP